MRTVHMSAQFAHYRGKCIGFSSRSPRLCSRHCTSCHHRLHQSVNCQWQDLLGCCATESLPDNLFSAEWLS